MNREVIISKVDHTQLSQTALWDDIKKVCDDGLKYNAASVCIPPCYVKKAKEYTKGRLSICTVVGFPSGYSTTAAKVFETSEAVSNGADEIDMVINIGMLKAGELDYIEDEIRQIKHAAAGRIVKVIIETCLLNQDEKINMCRIVTKAEADYIKTSTGFSTAGAQPDDIRLFKNHVGHGVKIKAAGGISSFDDAEEFIRLGADRLGTSKLVGAGDSGGY